MNTCKNCNLEGNHTTIIGVEESHYYLCRDCSADHDWLIKRISTNTNA